MITTATTAIPCWSYGYATLKLRLYQVPVRSLKLSNLATISTWMGDHTKIVVDADAKTFGNPRTGLHGCGIGSAFIFLPGSGSAFGMRIRIQERK